MGTRVSGGISGKMHQSRGRIGAVQSLSFVVEACAGAAVCCQPSPSFSPGRLVIERRRAGCERQVAGARPAAGASSVTCLGGRGSENNSGPRKRTVIFVSVIQAISSTCHHWGALWGGDTFHNPPTIGVNLHTETIKKIN